MLKCKIFSPWPVSGDSYGVAHQSKFVEDPPNTENMLLLATEEQEAFHIITEKPV